MYHFQSQVIFLSLISLTSAWTSKPTSVTRDSLRYINIQRLERTKLFQQNNEKNTTEWGVSYIGGDPCGSKYNSDPFDTKSGKPGMPDDMKERINLLAEKKKLESEEKSKNN